MTDILALDIATTTGWARGIVGEPPIAGAVCFGTSKSQNVVFAQAISWLSNYLRDQPRPDLVIMEGLLPAAAMAGETSRAARDRLAGLHGCMRGVAHLRGISEIAEASVGDVRAHFIGQRNLKSAQAKAAVMDRCKALGWQFCDNNAADALATWSYACGIIQPDWALKVSPLFNPSLRVRFG